MDVWEGNKLIAEFMGHKCSDMTIKKKDGFSVFTEYHSSWDWLMPVCQKISTLKISNFPLNVSLHTPSGIYIAINSNNWLGEEYLGKKVIVNTLNSNYFAETEVQEERYTFIESVWFGVVEFVKWYNLNKDKYE